MKKTLLSIFSALAVITNLSAQDAPLRLGVAMKRYVIIFLSLLMLLQACTGGSKETYFTNPVIPEDLADPSVIRVGDVYYACASSYNWGPEFPLFKSEDLVNWEQFGNIFQTKPEWTDAGFWAPELFEHNGRFYCYYSAGRASDGRHCLGAAVADFPQGPYEDMGVILDSGTEQIDAFVFDDDGQLYITWKAHGLDDCPIEIACSRLNDDGVTLEGEVFTILRDDERLGMEGQCMFKRDGWYYMLYSAKTCCGPGSDYDVRLARSRSIEGEWEKCPSNPVLAGDRIEVQSLGHGTTVETPDGRLFYLCHAYIPGEEFYLSRRPFLSELGSDGQGWIRCMTGAHAAISQKTPFKGTVQLIKTSSTDIFESAVRDPSWTCPVSDGSFQVLCKRPFSVNYEVSACLKQDEEPLKGLIFFGSFGDYVSLAAEGDRIVLRSVVGNVSETLKSWPLPQGDLILSAAVQGAVTATFSWRCGEETGRFGDGVGLSQLMRWDSCFRPGICSSAVDPAKSFSEFSIISQ